MKRMLKAVGVAAVGLALSLGAAGQDKPKKKLLFFTKSSGFEHSVIKKKGDEPSHAEKVLAELAKKNNWEITHTKDGSVFTKENIAKFDAFFFYTTGDLTKAGTDKTPPIPEEGKAAFLEAIRKAIG